MQLANNETDVSSCMKDKRGLMIFDFEYLSSAICGPEFLIDFHSYRPATKASLMERIC
jgi:hypothetical protein